MKLMSADRRSAKTILDRVRRYLGKGRPRPEQVTIAGLAKSLVMFDGGPMLFDRSLLGLTLRRLGWRRRRLGQRPGHWPTPVWVRPVRKRRAHLQPPEDPREAMWSSWDQCEFL